MLDLLRRKEARRFLLFATSLSALVLVVAHFVFAFCAEKMTSSLAKAIILTGAQLTGGILAGVATTAFLLFISRWLFAIEDKFEPVRSLNEADSQQEHLSQLAISDFWYHNGHIGRWVRTTVLPTFREAVKQKMSQKTVDLILLDPRDEELIEKFAQHRTLADGRELSFEEFVEDTKVQVYATIVCAAQMTQNFPSITVNVYLRRNLNYFRIDISQNCAFNTIARPHRGAVAFYNHDSDADMYDVSLFCHEQAKLESSVVDLNVALMPIRPGVADLIRFFAGSPIGGEANEYVSAQLGDERFLEKVLNESRSSKNPYLK